MFLPLLGAMRNPQDAPRRDAILRVATPLRGDEERVGELGLDTRPLGLLPLLGAMRNSNCATC